MALLVNGEGIMLSDYQAELEVYMATVLETEEAEQEIQDELISQLLLAQAAYQAGFTLDENSLEERLTSLEIQVGGAQALTDWMIANGYSKESFTRAFSRAVAAAWMRDQIVTAVPTRVEQVHARQVLVNSSDEANQLLASIQAGTTFASLVYKYDPVNSGDLGWFPRGYLSETAIEEAAFALQAGEVSPVIESSLGYHIIQVTERDPKHPLETEARLVLQTQALSEWLEKQRSQAEIQILLP